MKKRSFIVIAAITVLMSYAIPSCKPTVKDAEIVNNIESAKAGLSNMNNVNVTVQNGVVTLTGTVPSDQDKAAAENNIKTIEGVKSVVNDISVVAPPPPPPAQVFDNNMITTGVNTVLKDFKTVKAEVVDGVVTLTGEIKRDQLPKLMQMLHDLKPKNIVNNITVK